MSFFYNTTQCFSDTMEKRSDIMNTFEKARGFIYRNARPLDLARWQFHFENGSKENVLNALSFYQNADGGFGYGLEPDFLNPNSTPMATWAATEIIKEIEFSDKNHPIIKGILRYLESGEHFDAALNQWFNTVPSNNDYPHAIWWEYNGNSEFKYNPTAALAAFVLEYADEASEIYNKCCKIAEQAVDWFINAVPFYEQHVTSCFINLYKLLKVKNMISSSMTEFEQKLKEEVKCEICSEKEKWAVEYVTKPSDFKITPDSIFYADNAELAEYECSFIKEIQLPDGGFPVTWQWWTDYTEFYISVNFWKSDFVIKNMLYLKKYGE